MTVVSRVDGAVGWLHLDRPPVNALSAQSIMDLHEALKTLFHEPAVRCIVVAGSGRAFSAGAE